MLKAVIGCLVLTLSEIGIPKKLFENFVPILGPAHGLGALGVFQCLSVDIDPMHVYADGAGSVPRCCRITAICSRRCRAGCCLSSAASTSSL